mmetsp:Transcript_45111/g.112960  ORF Transcript_45111/g.112960 Transcript_45111/m.112960 type:complete len:243 (+) Transcript_45111:441-1169(+)
MGRQTAYVHTDMTRIAPCVHGTGPCGHGSMEAPCPHGPLHVHMDPMSTWILTHTYAQRRKRAAYVPRARSPPLHLPPECVLPVFTPTPASGKAFSFFCRSVIAAVLAPLSPRTAVLATLWCSRSCAKIASTACCRAVWLLGLDPADKGRLPTAAIVRIVGVVDGVCAKGVKVPLALATAVLRPGVVDKRHDFAPRDAAVAQPIVVLDFVLVGTSLAIAPSRLPLQFRVCLLDTLHTAVWAEP